MTTRATSSHPRSATEPPRESCTISPMETSSQRKQRNQEMNRLLGRWLASARAGNGIRQEEVAEAMGFMRPLVSKIEGGRRALDAAEVPAYARAIGVTPQELLAAILEAEAQLDLADGD